MKRSILVLCGITLLFAALSCKHEIPFAENTPVTGGTQICSPDTVYFQNKILPLLNSSCAMSGCHDAGTQKEGVILTSYASILSTGGVRPGNPGGSKLYKEIANNNMPPGNPFPTAQKNMIYTWILQGAKNNACSDCDSSIYTYSMAIGPLLSNYCTGCHSAASPGGGIDLSTYAAVKPVALNGKLMGSITHATGYSPMPKGSAQLPDCKIQAVQKWITAGALNN